MIPSIKPMVCSTGTRKSGITRHAPTVRHPKVVASIMVAGPLSPSTNLCTPSPPSRIPQSPAVTFLLAKACTSDWEENPPKELAPLGEATGIGTWNLPLQLGQWIALPAWDGITDSLTWQWGQVIFIFGDAAISMGGGWDSGRMIFASRFCVMGWYREIAET